MQLLIKLKTSLAAKNTVDRSSIVDGFQYDGLGYNAPLPHFINLLRSPVALDFVAKVKLARAKFLLPDGVNSCLPNLPTQQQQPLHHQGPTSPVNAVLLDANRRTQRRLPTAAGAESAPTTFSLASGKSGAPPPPSADIISDDGEDYEEEEEERRRRRKKQQKRSPGLE